MSVKFDDTGVQVKYLEFFLQTHYSSEARVSGIYDVYTHKNLIDYMNQRDVLTSKEIMPLLHALNVNTYFTIYSTVDGFELRSKDVLVENNSLYQYLSTEREKIFRMFASNGWIRTEYVAKANERVVAIFEKSDRKRLIPREILSFINLHTENYLLERGISNNDLSNPSRCVELINCKPNKKYYIYYRFGNRDDATKTNGVSISVSATTARISQLKRNSSISTINGETPITQTLHEFEGMEYTPTVDPSSNIESLTMLIEMPYDLDYYGTSLLVIEANDLPLNPDDYVPEYVKEFNDTYWNVYSKFMDYLFDMAISKYSDKETVYQLQQYLHDLYYWDRFDGIWTDLLQDFVKDYQIKNNIQGFGYCDVETESTMRIDISKGKTYKYGG